MKNVFTVLILVCSIFAGALEAVPQRGQASQPANSQSERQMLLDNCNIIRAYVGNQSAAMGALQSSGYRNSIKLEITKYLNSVGTPTAYQLLRELQTNGFSDFL